jgi:hypothetical protein
MVRCSITYAEAVAVADAVALTEAEEVGDRDADTVGVRGVGDRCVYEGSAEVEGMEAEADTVVL